MLRIISLILVLVGLAGAGAIASVFLMGTASPVAALVSPYVCKEGTNLVIGDGKPMFDYTVPLECDDPDSQFDTDPSGNLFQLGFGLFIPAGIGLWLLRIASRWKAAGDYSRAMGYGSTNASPSRDLNHLSEDELLNAMEDITGRAERNEISPYQMQAEMSPYVNEAQRRQLKK